MVDGPKRDYSWAIEGNEGLRYSTIGFGHKDLKHAAQERTTQLHGSYLFYWYALHCRRCLGATTPAPGCLCCLTKKDALFRQRQQARATRIAGQGRSQCLSQDALLWMEGLLQRFLQARSRFGRHQAPKLMQPCLLISARLPG